MKVQRGVVLARWCTLEVGGPARWFCEVDTESGLREALDWANLRGVPVHVLGGGSNVVVADEGFDGLVVRVNVRGVRSKESGDLTTFVVGAGEGWDELVATTVARGCGGLECLSGIPGLVGGAPIQNIGAYGQEVSPSIVRVHVIDRTTGVRETFQGADCGFGYRTSRFKRADRDRFVVTAVEFSLARRRAGTVAYPDVASWFERARQSVPSPADVREAVLRIRRGKGMVIEAGNPANRSVGSFFVNPVITEAQLARLGPRRDVPHYRLGPDAVKIPAAWLIERAGFPKGYSRGTAGVSPLHPLALVNLGGARAADIVALAADVKRAVWSTFGIPLVPEPVLVGFRPTADVAWLLEGWPGR
jgi:UDP-N-acetylmuramate dehydrogenase